MGENEQEKGIGIRSRECWRKSVPICCCAKSALSAMALARYVFSAADRSDISRPRRPRRTRGHIHGSAPTEPMRVR